MKIQKNFGLSILLELADIKLDEEDGCYIVDNFPKLEEGVSRIIKDYGLNIKSEQVDKRGF